MLQKRWRDCCARQGLVNQCADLTSGAERLQRERDDLAAKLEEVQREIAQGKGKTTMLKIIGGMAIDAYRADIHGMRITGITAILEGLASVGVDVDENTLRARLRDAAEHVNPRK